MQNAVIRAENLSKKYTLGIRSGLQGGRTSLRDQLTQTARGFTRNLKRKLSSSAPPAELPGDFWALKDISFDVQQGEIVGIVGRNGAGKSTLLKILSRITEPTTGRVEIEGRVASLLEVGTGFHSELTGRENIYLNGAILGMSKAEISRKFDEIVAFAEVEKFLETPVKRYSSGMYVRLAFAVAAHLEPEILIVDEVLAVGDTAFQKKCLGKMGDVSAKEGRTVLFVSHNMETVQSLCQRACLLDSGQVVTQGPTADVINQYLASVRDTMLSEGSSLAQRQDRSGDGSARFTAIEIEDADGGSVVRANSRLKITLRYEGKAPLLHPQFSATVYDYNRSLGLVSLSSKTTGGLPDTIPASGEVTCITEPLYLTPGRCYINLSLYRAGGSICTDYIQYAGYFDVEGCDIFGLGKLPERDWVVCLREHAWHFQESRALVQQL
mgnify:CR=1 FL=1